VFGEEDETGADEEDKGDEEYSSCLRPDEDSDDDMEEEEDEEDLLNFGLLGGRYFGNNTPRSRVSASSYFDCSLLMIRSQKPWNMPLKRLLAPSTDNNFFEDDDMEEEWRLGLCNRRRPLTDGGTSSAVRD